MMPKDIQSPAREYAFMITLPRPALEYAFMTTLSRPHTITTRPWFYTSDAPPLPIVYLTEEARRRFLTPHIPPAPASAEPTVGPSGDP
jgi:hypothetical protein